MKISVVTAVYNRRATIAHAIQSVREQTYPDVEHIIQDGGSTDGTLDLLQGLASPNMLVQSAPDTGIYDALNRGIARASGDIIGLLHSDDFFASPHVLEQVASVLKTKGVDGVYGDLDYVRQDDPARVVRRWRSGPYSPEHLPKGWMIPHPTLYLKREVYERWGDYDTTLRIAADYDAMLRWFTQGGIRLHYLPEVFVKMRTGGQSNGSLRWILQKSREDYVAIKRHCVGGVRTLLLKNLSKVRQFGFPSSAKASQSSTTRASLQPPEATDS